MLELLKDLAFSSNGIVVAVIVLILVLIITSEYQRNYRLPPGPYGLPWVGYLPWFDSDKISEQTANLCEKYKTDILSITVLGHHFILLNTFELTKEVFQKRTDVVDRALYMPVFRSVIPDFSGVLVNSGRGWKEMRRFTLALLRDFGMGRSTSEEMVKTEAKMLCELFRTKKGEAFNPQSFINIAVSNLTCGLIFGKRFDLNDEVFYKALDAMNKFVASFNSLAAFMIVHHRFVRDVLLKRQFQKTYEDLADYTRFVKQEVDEHKKKYCGQETDFIYVFLKEMEGGRDPEVFNDAMLESVIADFFLAGSETTYTTLRWILLSMLAYPDVYRKVREEVDQVIGDREPDMNDKKHTPYVEAVINECQRHYTLLPVGVGHTNLQNDFEINGYRIPKGSFVCGNMDKIHHDKNSWKNPDVFDPENFLKDGQVLKTEKLVPFGVGRRSCSGESLARSELYLFFVNIIKNFDIKLETDDAKPNLIGYQGAVYAPKPYKLRMIPRS